MSILGNLDAERLCDHFEGRVDISRDLRRFFNSGDVEAYVPAALGVEPRSTGNYSADAHGLGPKILDNCTPSQVFDLARDLNRCSRPEEIPSIICEKHRLPFLAISVGSEMAMMLHPDRFWVVNARTIWAHLWVQEDFDAIEANKRAEGWRIDSGGPEVSYALWKAEYRNLEVSLRRVAEVGTDELEIQAAENLFLWADSIAAFVYKDE